MKHNVDKKKQLIRNSTAEFLIFTGQAGEQSIQTRYEDDTIWLTQKLIAKLFDVTVPTINEHLKNIYDQGELKREAIIRKFLAVQLEGKRDKNRSQCSFFYITKRKMLRFLEKSKPVETTF
jgi:hypothetical protein